MDSRKKIRRIFWENINYPVLYSMYSKVIDLLSSSSSEEEEEEDSVVGQPKKKHHHDTKKNSMTKVSDDWRQRLHSSAMLRHVSQCLSPHATNEKPARFCGVLICGMCSINLVNSKRRGSTRGLRDERGLFVMRYVGIHIPTSPRPAS